MSKVTITRQEHRLALGMYFDDCRFLVKWLSARLPDALIEKHATVALTFNAESGWSWRKLASYAFAELKSIEAERALTPMELRVRSIAEGLYDSGVSAADRFGIDLFPEDKDRAKARELLDERFQRAVEELRPFTQGENDDV